MDGTARFVQGMTFTLKADSGHAITVDSTPDFGGTDQGARPMELVLLGLAGCTGMDVISLLRKMRQHVTAYEVRVHGDRASDYPKVFTDMVIEHVVTGSALDASLVRRAVELSATKYCPVSAMLAASATLHHGYRLIDLSTGQEYTGTLDEELVQAVPAEQQ